MENSEQLMYLNNEWFNSDANSGSITTTTGGASITTTGAGWDTNYYYTPTYWWPYTVQAKVRLKLSEVEHIRKLCKSDRKLRAAMRKFAPHIEVEVDFPG